MEQKKKEKEVTLKIESSVSGHEVKTYGLSVAVQEVLDQTQNQGKWLYVDGMLVATGKTDEKGRKALSEVLAGASDITLVQKLVGG